MRPRYQEVSTEVANMLEKAQSLLNKAEKLDMVEHDGKKVPAFAADGKGSKDEKKKYGTMKKGEHHKVQSFDTRPGGVQFMSESGGQTFNAQYQTNQSLLDSDDVANKGATSMSFNLEALRSRMNTHENPVEGHLTEG